MRLILIVLLVIFVSAQYNESLGKLFGQMTVASYCRPSLINAWTCDPCKKVANMKFVTVMKNSTNDTLGYIAVNDDLNATVLVFRGTLPWDVKNWISDINFLKTKYAWCDNGCEVHRGFYDDYLDIANSVKENVQNYTAVFKKKYLYVVGHSLGAALATHAVAHLNKLGIKVDVFYNLGSPRVGDSKFHEWFNRVLGHFAARITHWRDPVPHLPLEAMGFQHIHNEVFYNENSSVYKICSNTGEDKTCSDQFNIDASVTDHITYFGIDYTAEVLQCQ